MDPQKKQCPRCERELKADAPSGLCPSCLMEINLQSGVSMPGGGRSRIEPWPVEEVARRFPELEIVGLLGSGGMGAVYKARQPKLDRFVALKILAPERDDAGFVDRFSREAKTLARLDHPNIVGVHDFGEKEGIFFLIMELVDGVTLRDLLSEGRLKPEQALSIVPPMCEALQYAHDKGVVHRDIKPENILLDKEGRVKVADFGIARLAGTEAAGGLTGEGQVVGTAHYMAPEQVERPASVDHRADIYALGVVFYEMLTGELPLGRFPNPSKKVQIDVRLDEVVLKALEKEPEQRYQQASEVRTRVETIAGTREVRRGRESNERSLPVGVRTAIFFFASAAFLFAALVAGHWAAIFLSLIAMAGFFVAGIRVLTHSRGSATGATGEESRGAKRIIWVAAAIVAILLIAFIVVSVGGVIASIAIPAFHRSHSRVIPGEEIEVRSRSEALGPEIRHLLPLLGAQQPAVGLDLDKDRFVELSQEAPLVQQASENGIDLIAHDGDDGQWVILTTARLASLDAAAWKNRVDWHGVDAALRTGKVDLPLDDPMPRNGWRAYQVGGQPLPITLAFETDNETRGVLQIYGVKETVPNGVRIRYRRMQKVRPAASTADGDYRVAFPNGVSFEVMAVCRNPRESDLWWKPDGTPLPNGIVSIQSGLDRRGGFWTDLGRFVSGRDSQNLSGQGSEVLIYVRRNYPLGWPDDLYSYQYDWRPSPSRGGSQLFPNIRWHGGESGVASSDLLTFDEVPDVLSLGITIPLGPWEPVAIYDGASLRELANDIGAVFRIVPDAKKPNDVALEVMHNIDVFRRHGVRLTARLKDGGTRPIFHHSTATVSEGRFKTTVLMSGFDGFRPSDVQEFELARTDLVKGEIRGINLAPQRATANGSALNQEGRAAHDGVIPGEEISVRSAGQGAELSWGPIIERVVRDDGEARQDFFINLETTMGKARPLTHRMGAMSF